ncbi:pilus assembly protein [Sphingomonas sp.]|uniref:TadE/TadG family type IV pilus assembly protein n=1 Tax=Sphingomonas sp. TaxID=28214 RepID=UPI0025D6E406|nr:pilus assembly protein [Sphingomonas sp.]
MKPSLRRLRLAYRLAADRSGVALIEFGFSLPILLVLCLTGAELTNYVITRMRVSQIALHLADNAARIGSGSQLQSKTITEADINDLLTGAGLQAGELDLYPRGRVIVSSIVPKSDPNPSGHYVINWQRCRGDQTGHASSYGNEGDMITKGMGRKDREAFAPPGGATIFVEVYYQYRPLVQIGLAPTTEMTEIASMVVRDNRDNTGGNNGVYPVNGVAASTC